MMRNPLKQAPQGFQRPFDPQLERSLVLIGSATVYNAVRAGFVRQGTSLNKWCLANGLNRYTAERALKGDTTTRAALALVAKLAAAAGC